MLIARPASLIEGRAHETILEDGARRGVPRRRLVTAAPGGTGPRPPGTTTRTRGARCDRSGSNSGEGSAGPEPKIATVRAPGGGRPALWDARRLVRRLACPRHGQAQRVPRKHPTTLGAPPPFDRGSEAKVSKPGRRKRTAGTKRCCLVRALSVGHSGRAAMRRGPESITTGRGYGFPILRDASQRAAAAPGLASRCDASQHEGEHHSHARVMHVSMRTSD